MAMRKATVVGSSAYDLERIGAIPEIPFDHPREFPKRIPDHRERERVNVRPETEERVKERARTRSREKARQGQYISVFAVVGTMAVVVMVFLVILSYIQLAVTTDEISALESQLGELNEEQTTLKVEHDSTFNLREVEDYARNVIGMTEPAEGQIFYLESDIEDRAVILDQKAVKDFGILSAITSFFSSIVE